MSEVFTTDDGKLRVRRLSWGRLISFWCPGCQAFHCFRVYKQGTDGWRFNDDYRRPTFSPAYVSSVPPRCHVQLEEGVLSYLSDCRHNLAGQRVPLGAIPNWTPPRTESLEAEQPED